MKRLVLDASIALKWFFIEEKGADRAWKILERTKRGELKIVVPQIFFFEIANVVKTKARSTSGDVREVIKAIFSLEITSPKTDANLLLKANFYAQKYNLTIYDASYLALAKILGIDLITADEKLRKKVNLKFVKSLEKL